MGSGIHFIDFISFAVVPYVAIAVFVLGSVYRYRLQPYTYSSFSSQLLENKRHFWASMPFHYAILIVLAGHLVAFLVPRSILLWNSHPLRLFILQVTALACGIIVLAAITELIARRLTNHRVRAVTRRSDWVLYAVLLIQITSGVAVAVLYPWGTSWFASAMSPYLWSLFTLAPDVTAVAAMPHLVKLHVVNAFVFIGIVPFTRMVHVLVAPLPYLWRKPQVVRWYGEPRDAGN